MKLKLLSVIALAAMCGAAPVRAGERLFVLQGALVDPSAPISRGVREECALESQVSSALLNAVRRLSPDATAVTATSEVPPGEKVVVATILSIHGIAGGGWTGAKSISVRADLMQNGRVIGSRVISRTMSSKSFRGIIGDTCMLFSRLVPQIGNEMYSWLSDAPPAEPVLLVQIPAEIAEDSPMPANFRTECGLPSLVGNQVLKAISSSFAGIAATDATAPDAKGRVLKLLILDFKADNELLKSTREVTLRADLVEGAKVVSTKILQGTASARRGSKEGACSILERACAAAARDAANWLGQGLINPGGEAQPAAAPEPARPSDGAASRDDPPPPSAK